MSRTRFLLGILILMVMISWVMTFFYHSRLPAKIPAHFSFDGTFTLGERWTFFVAPVLNTILAVAAMLLYPVRRHFNFPGDKKLKELPKEFSEPVYQRAYQIVIMLVIFISIMMTFIQVNVAFIATGRTNAFNIMPFYGVITIIIVYLVFSLFSLSRMAKAAKDYHNEWKERGENE